MDVELKNFLAEQLEENRRGFTETLDKKQLEDQRLRDDLNSLTVKFAEQGLKGSYGPGNSKSVGQQLIDSSQMKAMINQGAGRSGKLQVGSLFEHKALTRDVDGSALVAADRLPGIARPGEERFGVRDLLRVIPTNSNLVEFIRENSFTNNAAVIYNSSPSPTGMRENLLKPESALGFVSASEKVETLASWIPVSRQLLADLPALSAFIDSRLRYGLALKEEEQILFGSGGAAGQLNGIVTQATAADVALWGASPSTVDKLAAGVFQVQNQSKYEASGIVLNPYNWFQISNLKDGEARYLFVDPRGRMAPTLWGMPVVTSTAMTVNQFLVGAFSQGAVLWDRQQATVEVALEHADFFVRNMAAVLCEERVALTVLQPSSFVYGAL